MDSSNPQSNTQNAQGSDNPQDTSTPRGNESSDFQETAPPNSLNESTENLTVETTGEPISGGSTNVVNEGLPTSWIVGIILIVVIGGYVFYKLLKETIEESTPEVAPSKATVKKSSSSTKPASKSTAKKKSSPNKRKKSSAKKRK